MATPMAGWFVPWKKHPKKWNMWATSCRKKPPYRGRITRGGTWNFFDQVRSSFRQRCLSKF